MKIIMGKKNIRYRIFSPEKNRFISRGIFRPSFPNRLKDANSALPALFILADTAGERMIISPPAAQARNVRIS